MTKKTPLTPAAIDRVIRGSFSKLRKPGVLTVRPGFEIANHQLSGNQAIVVTVHTKTSDLPTKDLLPNTLGRIRVDVREATPHQRLRAHDPAAATMTQMFGRSQDQEPSWPLEREMPSGRLLVSGKSDTQLTLKAQAARQPILAQALRSAASKPELDYVAPAGAPLVPLQGKVTVTAHVSPDSGFATLTQFLKGTRSSLVIGMYDFTSGPILALFKQVLTGRRTLQMVLDNPIPNPTRNQLDSQTVAELNAALGARSKIVRALSRSDTLVDAWIFPYAYHIKVLVRDEAVVWLSSGNLNNSNQPDPAAPPKTEDRDWHLIIEDERLAALFTAYLDQDFNAAVGHQNSVNPALTEALADAAAKLAAETTSVTPATLVSTPAPPVPAKVFSNIDVTMTPLLTPDNVPADAPRGPGEYVTTMVRLLSSAKKTLYIQLQYIEASAATGDYPKLLQTIADRVAAGIDVRLIESLEYGEQWAEKMKSSGVDLTANIALQSNVHNKGFVIDSSIVVVSSQNFSPAGIRNNRDAGVIVESAPIAQYFEQIFLSDWNKLQPFAPKAIRGPSSRARIKLKGSPVQRLAINAARMNKR